MNLVVGDIETSENNVNMLSVLEASFVIYDERFKELESFHESARIRPTCVPSLGACLTTGIRTDKLIGANNSSFELATKIHNTLSKSLAESDIQKEPFKKKFTIECKPLTEIIDNTKFSERKIDFLNIDAEGYDYQVLLGLDIKKYCPRAICIEISPLVDKKNENYKDTKIYKYLLQNNYKLTWKGSNSFIFLFQPEQQLV